MKFLIVFDSSISEKKTISDSTNISQNVLYDDNGEYSEDNEKLKSKFYFEKNLKIWFKSKNIKAKLFYLDVNEFKNKEIDDHKHENNEENKNKNDIEYQLKQYLNEHVELPNFSLDGVLFLNFNFSQKQINKLSLFSIKEFLKAQGMVIPFINIDYFSNHIKNLINYTKEMLQKGFDDFFPFFEDIQLLSLKINNLIKLYQSLNHEEQLKKEIIDIRKTNINIINDSDVPVVYLNEGFHVKANKSYLRLLHVDNFSEIEHTSILDLIDKEDLDSFKCLLKHFHKDKNNALNKNGILSLMNADNKKVKVFVNISPITYDEENCLKLTFKKEESILNTKINTDKIINIKNEDTIKTIDNEVQNLSTISAPASLSWIEKRINEKEYFEICYQPVITLLGKTRPIYYMKFKLQDDKKINFNKMVINSNLVEEKKLLDFYTWSIKQPFNTYIVNKITKDSIHLWIDVLDQVLLKEGLRNEFYDNILKFKKGNPNIDYFMTFFVHLTQDNRQAIKNFSLFLKENNLSLGLTIYSLDKKFPDIKDIDCNIISISTGNLQLKLGNTQENINKIKELGYKIAIYDIDNINLLPELYKYDVNYIQGSAIAPKSIKMDYEF